MSIIYLTILNLAKCYDKSRWINGISSVSIIYDFLQPIKSYQFSKRARHVHVSALLDRFLAMSWWVRVGFLGVWHFCIIFISLPILVTRNTPPRHSELDSESRIVALTFMVREFKGVFRICEHSAPISLLTLNV